MIDKKIREAHDATNDVLNQLDGVIATFDLIENEITLPDEQSISAKAFRSIRPLLTEKMAEVWELRSREWASVGGNNGS